MSPADITCIRNEIEAVLKKRSWLSAGRLRKILRKGGRRLSKRQLRVILKDPQWGRVQYVQLIPGRYGWAIVMGPVTF